MRLTGNMYVCMYVCACLGIVFKTALVVRVFWVIVLVSYTVMVFD